MISRKNSIRLRLGLIFILLVVGFNNCNQAGDVVLTAPTQNLETPNLASSIPAEELPEITDPAVEYVDKEKTVDVKFSNKVDVLVVVDDSGSMSYEQSSMANRFGSFFNQLSGLDWQLSITTTDTRSNLTAGGDGKFLEFFSLPGKYILDSSMNMDLAKSAFAGTIQRPTNGSGNEQGIYNSYRAIERYLDATVGENMPNNRFFRDDAAFAAIVVSDADESVANDTNSDLVKREANLKTRNKPEELVKLVDQTWQGQKVFSFNAIIVKPGDDNCRKQTTAGGNEGYGDIYDRLVKMTGGVTGSVCEADYGSQLSILGKKVSELIKSVTLECSPVDSDKDGKADVIVLNSKGEQEKNFTVSGMQVTFATALPDGLNSIRYRCVK